MVNTLLFQVDLSLNIPNSYWMPPHWYYQRDKPNRRISRYCQQFLSQLATFVIEINLLRGKTDRIWSRTNISPWDIPISIRLLYPHMLGWLQSNLVLSEMANIFQGLQISPEYMLNLHRAEIIGWHKLHTIDLCINPSQ